MANTLRFKRGLVATIPTALAGEPLFTTDTFDLYIGNGTTNTRFQKYIASGATTQILRGDGSLYTFPLAISSPSNGQVLKYNGTSWVNDSDSGITGSGVAGQVAYFTGATTQAGSNNLFWDATNSRLGIGTNTPGGNLDVRGSANPQIRVSDGTITTKMQSVTSLAAYIGTESNHQLRLITNNTPQITIFGGGNVHVGGTSDVGQRLQVTGTALISDTLRVNGNIAINNAPLTDVNLYIRKSLSGSIAPTALYIDSTVTSTSTTAAAYFVTSASTENATFTLPNLYHFYAIQGTYGASSTVTNQYGFFADSTLIGATNDYGFYGNIASGTGRWNLYMNGTANNYLAGNLGIGVPVPVPYTVGARCINILSSTTTAELSIRNSTTGNTAGSGMILTNFGVNAHIINANTGFLGFSTSDTLRMTLAANGNLLIGSTTDSGERLQVTGTMRVTGAVSIGGNSNLTLNQNAGSFFRVQNTTAGTGSYSELILQSDATAGSGSFGKVSSSYTPYKILTASSTYIYNGTAGDIAFLNDVASGTIKFAAGASSTAQLTLNASGNLGLGVTPSAWRTTERALQIGTYTSVTDVFGYSTFGNNYFVNASSQYIFLNNARASVYSQNAGVHAWSTSTASGTAGNAITFTQAMTLDASGNLLLGSTTSSGERLQVTGTAKITGATSIVNDTNAAAGLSILNPNTGTSAISRLNLGSANSNWFFDAVRIGGNLSIKNNISGSPVELLSITNGGNLAVDTNTLFVDATNDRVGIGTTTPANKLSVTQTTNNLYCASLVTSVSTGTSYGLRIQAGTNSSDTSLAIFNQAGSSYLTVRGDGNIGVGTALVGANGTSTISVTSGTAPSANLSDTFQMYSADITAGNAAPHFRTENGAVIKLYQQDNGVAAANYVSGIGSAVTTLDAFDGYTIGQVVKALRNAGILS
jgi:hypothetical protein